MTEDIKARLRRLSRVSGYPLTLIHERYHTWSILRGEEEAERLVALKEKEFGISADDAGKGYPVLKNLAIGDTIEILSNDTWRRATITWLGVWKVYARDGKGRDHSAERTGKYIRKVEE